MTIEEKGQKIEEHCKCSECELSDFGVNCWDIIKYGSWEGVEKIYNKLTYGTVNITRNIAKVSDTFICEECGIHLENCMKTVYDEDTEDTYCHEYEFKFCPECGRKIVEE